MAKLAQARCVAAKALKIQINPQLGQFNSTQYQIVTVPGTVSRPAGASPSPLGLTSAC